MPDKQQDLFDRERRDQDDWKYGDEGLVPQDSKSFMMTDRKELPDCLRLFKIWLHSIEKEYATQRYSFLDLAKKDIEYAIRRSKEAIKAERKHYIVRHFREYSYMSPEKVFAVLENYYYDQKRRLHQYEKPSEMNSLNALPRAVKLQKIEARSEIVDALRSWVEPGLEAFLD